MRKTVLSIAIAAMALTSFGTMAQTPSTPTTPQATCCQQSDCNQQCPGEARGKKGTKGEIRMHKADPFAGINLTDAQKAKLQQLQEQRKTERDSQRAAARNGQNKGERPDRNAARKKYIEDVKSVLTPEQYVVFLENMATTVPAKPEQRAGHKRHVKGDRKHDVKRGRVERNSRTADTSTSVPVTPTVKATRKVAQ